MCKSGVYSSSSSTAYPNEWLGFHLSPWALASCLYTMMFNFAVSCSWVSELVKVSHILLLEGSCYFKYWRIRKSCIWAHRCIFITRVAKNGIIILRAVLLSKIDKSVFCLKTLISWCLQLLMSVTVSWHKLQENGLSLIDKIMLELEEPINESTHQYSLETISLKWSYPELLHSPYVVKIGSCLPLLRAILSINYCFFKGPSNSSLNALFILHCFRFWLLACDS